MKNLHMSPPYSAKHWNFCLQKKKPLQRTPLRICMCPVWSWCTHSIVVELRAAFGCLSGAVSALFGGVTPKVVGFVYAWVVSNIRLTAAQLQFQTSWSMQEDLTVVPGKPRTEQRLKQCKQEYIWNNKMQKNIQRSWSSLNPFSAVSLSRSHCCSGASQFCLLLQPFPGRQMLLWVKHQAGSWGT